MRTMTNLSFKYRNMKEKKTHVHLPLTTAIPEIFNIRLNKELVAGLVQQ